MKNQTDVLVVGGGFGGIVAAQKLAENGVDVTLIDRKNYSEVTFATLRNVADPKTVGNTARKLYSDFIKANFIQANVESMNDKEAKLANGESIAFKQAIIATGSRYPTLSLAKSNSAFDYAERNQEMLDAYQELSPVKSVLIIGGGLVGVELAGEIISAFPDKKITLAHASDTLLEHAKPKAQRRALEILRAEGVDVKFNRRFAKDDSTKGENVYRCSITNETIQPDIAYVCVGLVPNTEFLQAELPGILDEKGLVKVDSYMKVEGYKNLYSLGDCANLDNEKHGYITTIQGDILADILLKTAQGKTVKPYKTPTIFVITPIGQNSGIAHMPFGLTSTWNFIVNLKRKDLGIGEMYKAFGTEPDALE